MSNPIKIKIPRFKQVEKSPSPPPSPPSSSAGTSPSSAYSPSSDDENQPSNPNEEEASSNGGSENMSPAAQLPCDNNEIRSDYNAAGDNINIVDNETKKPSGRDWWRIWTPADEIAVLKGLVGYHTVNGPFPMTAAGIGDFHAAVAESLSIRISNAQLVDKVRMLRRRYMRGSKSWKRTRFSKPHDELAYELSRRLWGGGGGGGEEEEGAARKRAGAVRKHCPMLMEAVEGTGNMAAEEAAGAMETARARGLEERLKRRRVEGMSHHLVRMELRMETFKLIMDGIKNSSR